jgi:hypothetical protein
LIDCKPAAHNRGVPCSVGFVEVITMDWGASHSSMLTVGVPGGDEDGLAGSCDLAKVGIMRTS